MKIAICDDELIITDTLKQYLKLYYGNEILVDVFYSGLDYLKAQNKYDILFLDINLGNVNGIDIAKKIREYDKKVFIVFITHYNGYKQHAFSVHAFEYILKPLTKEQIFQVLDEIRLYRTEDVQEKSISLRREQGLIQVKIKDIEYFEYSDRKVKMMFDDEPIFLQYSLTQIVDSLKDCDFIMPHKSFLINIRKIAFIHKYDIIMQSGNHIPLAQKKAASFKKQLESYLYLQAEIH